MSFQRKNQIIGRTPTSNRGPILNRNLGQGRTSSIAPSITPAPLLSQRRPVPNVAEASTEPQQTPNLSVKPSILTSEPAVSTGCSDLDKLLLHGGLPVGSSLVFEETGSTDYALILLKYFATQGILHNRVEGKQKDNCHVIVIGANPNLWLKELPGVYKGSRKEVKKQQILNNESKLSVQNLVNNPSAGTTPVRAHGKPAENAAGNNLKIAWRYGLKNSNFDAKNSDLSSVNYPHYNNTFDITTRLIPSPSSHEMTFLQIPQSSSGRPGLILMSLYKQLEGVVKNQTKNGSNNKIIRIVIPNLLNPSVYSAETFSPAQILPFLQLLKTLVSQYHRNLTLVSSISLDLFAPDLESDTSVPSNKSPLVIMIEKLFDSVLQLVPFEQNLIKLLEISYKNQPNKIQQGFINVIKITNVSDKGAMIIKMNEFAFRNGKRNFEISEWSIPVDNEEVDEKTKEIHDVQPEQSAKNIEF